MVKVDSDMKKLLQKANQKMCWGVLCCEIVLLFVFLFVWTLYNQLLTNYNQSLERDRWWQLLSACLAQHHRLLWSVLSRAGAPQFLHLNFITAKYTRGGLLLLLYHLSIVLRLCRLFLLKVCTRKTPCLVLANAALLSLECHLLQLLLLQFGLLPCLSLPNNLLLPENLLVGRIHLQESLQLRHSHWFTVSLCDHIVKGKN